MIVILGESGSGKSALVDALVAHDKKYKKLVTYTTRPKREGETNGVDYHFISNETFDEFGVFFDNEKFYNFSFGDDGNSPVYRTNKETGKTSQVIDHIIVSRDTFVWKDDEVKNGYYFRWHDGASDHQMIYAYVNLLD